jgi:hypothetical protein
MVFLDNILESLEKMKKAAIEKKETPNNLRDGINSGPIKVITKASFSERKVE